ncbi:hypothetical protein CENDO_10895 [Corynebacterium endometrii]|uniref:Polyprenol-phosphate-mannose-dependent alpha-(1-2)-phosphatidylinositol mannoside mannosyltransferase n=2 Tax=Corynebacterium endometrii TaxID=2488819 RepID=A0A4P7QIC3_9CORY|nr:hypothetical protein CENDO_10895 [Corynebacterium endometrii]
MGHWNRDIVTLARRVPASAEPMARGVVNFVGGPRGRFSRGGASAGTPLLAITAFAWTFLALGFLSKANCAGGWRGDDGIVHLDWSGNRQYISACYNDIVPLFGGRGLDQGGFPYAYSWVEGDLTRYMEYPVLAGLFQGAVAWASRLSYPVVEWAGVPLAGWYFAVTALVMSVFWVATVLLVSQLLGNRIWDAVLVAASPLVIVHAFTNWDLMSIFFAVVAMWLAARKKMAWAGVAIGLGTAFKLWPLFLLGAYLVLAVRHKKIAPWGVMVGSAAASWMVVNFPVALAYPQAWGEFYRLNSTRGAEWTTIYAMFNRVTGVGLPVDFLNTFSLLGFLACCVAIGIFGLKARRTPRVAELVYLILAAFLLFNKVWSPQYSLWLLVPAVLALPRWRLVFAWGVADALLWPILMLHMMGTENKGLPQEFLDAAVLARDGLIIAMAVIIIRQMLGKARDKVAVAHAGMDLLAGPWGGHRLSSDAAPVPNPAPTPAAASEPASPGEATTDTKA